MPTELNWRSTPGWDSVSWDGDDDGDDESDDEGDDDKICLCHNGQTICVSRAAVCAHLLHGDSMGPCPETCGGEEGIDCDDGQYCLRPDGECSEIAEGECVDLPDVCPPPCVVMTNVSPSSR